MSAKWGVIALLERRLKISEIETTNDPWECLPFDLTDPQAQQNMKALRTQYAEGRGLVCFSARWSSPLLWAHYADCHQGLCLSFEAYDDHAERVSYVDAPIPVPTGEEKRNIFRLLGTKYSHWAYEEEVRLIPFKVRHTATHYYFPFEDGLKLVAVVLGAKCEITPRAIRRALGNYDEVKIMRAKFAVDAFQVVEDPSFDEKVNY